MSKLLLLVDERYIGRITWRSQLALDIIRKKFEELKTLDRARAWPFKQFFEAPSLRFLGVIIHLLLRKIKSGSKNEIHFEIGGRFVKFGIGEFSLITGLNFGSYPE